MLIHCSHGWQTRWIMDMPQEKPSQTGPESAAEYFILKFNIRYISFPKKRLIGKPQHATTELSQIETWELAEYSIIEYLAKFDSHTMLADTGWCTAQSKGDDCGYWIFRKRNEARLALDKAQHLTCHHWTFDFFFPPKIKGWKPCNCNS